MMAEMGSTSSIGMAAAAGIQFQQIANARHRPLIDQGGKLAILAVVAAHHRRLQRGDDVRVVHVVLAVVHVLEQAALLDFLAGIPGAPRQMIGVGLEVVEVRAGNPAVRALEAQADHLLAQAHDLEQLRAAVARDGGNAHLGHDLEQSLADAAAIAAAEFLPHRRFHFQRAGAHEIEQGLIGEIRVDGGRPVADQAGEMMRIARRAGLHQDVALAAQSGLDQAVMHRAGGEQGVHGHLALDQVAVRQQQHDLAAAHRVLRVIADLEQRGLEVHVLVVLQIDEFIRHPGIGQRHDLPQFALREHRR